MTFTNWAMLPTMGAFVAALAVAPHALPAQTMTPAPVLQIFEELIKPGHGGMHAMTESAWPRAFARAKVTAYYLAMNSQTGTPRMWFMAPWNSLMDLEASDREIEMAPGLSEELDRIGVADAEHTQGYRILLAVLRPDLTYDAIGLDMADARYMEVTMFRVRPGKEEVFTNMAKGYLEMARTNKLPSSWAIYQMQYGTPGPTFMMLQSRRMMGEYDVNGIEGSAWMSAMKPDKMAKLNAAAAEAVVSVESNLFRFAPSMSFMSAEFIARDSLFWRRP